MIIDVHGHIGQHGNRPFSADWMSAYLQRCDVDRLLVSNLDAASEGPNAANCEEPDANLASLSAARTNRRLAALYWVRLGKFDSNVHAFEGALRVEPFLGAAFHPALGGYGLDDERLDPYFALLARLKKPAVVHTHHEKGVRPVDVYTLAKRHQFVSIVMCNVGGEKHWSEAIDVVAGAHKHEDARVYLCTAGATAADAHDAVRRIGGDHVLFGSNATVLGEQHAERFSAWLAEVRETMGAEVFEKLTCENAAGLFRIPVKSLTSL